MKQILLHIFIFLIVSANIATAQVTFVNPYASNAKTDFNLNTGQITTTTGDFTYSQSASSIIPYSVTVYRPNTSTARCYAVLFGGNSWKNNFAQLQDDDTSLPSSPSNTDSNAANGWQNIYSNGQIVEQSHRLDGSFNTGRIAIGCTDVYVVLFDGSYSPAKQIAVSDPIQIRTTGPRPTSFTAPYLVNSTPLKADAGSQVTVAIGGLKFMRNITVSLNGVTSNNFGKDATYSDNIVRAVFTVPTTPGTYQICSY